MRKRLMVGLLAGGLLFAMAAPAVAQDYSGSISGSLTLHGGSEPFNVAVTSVTASGDPTDARGRFQYRVTYRDSSGAIVTHKSQGRVTCFARIGDRAYVEYRLTKVIRGSAQGPQVGDHLVEAWEDNSATGKTDLSSLGAMYSPGPGHCADQQIIDGLDFLLDSFPPAFVRHGNITIR